MSRLRCAEWRLQWNLRNTALHCRSNLAITTPPPHPPSGPWNRGTCLNPVNYPARILTLWKSSSGFFDTSTKDRIQSLFGNFASTNDEGDAMGT
ncbi:hypothetical protein BaRGS_00007040 [Batillaria attramentaria]|uniref:Uncharacterized protein n=1 Tax=Batillaria attramentaria TaxID=370345 RepID=A0ABD0LRH9_9CAEN